MKTQILNRIFPFFLLALTCSSCVWRHVTPTHNTPHFTDKNQFEVAYTLALTGVNLNLAYSPVKYLAFHLNGCSALGSSDSYNAQAEGGIGGYFPMWRFVAGVTGGYGLGATAWDRWWYAKESSGELKYAKFDTEKFYLNYYLSCRIRDSLFMGLSAKVNYLHDFYFTSYSDNGNFRKNNYVLNGTGYELAYFVKFKMDKRTYFNIQAGLSVYAGPDNRDSEFHPLASVGFSHRF